MVRNGRPRNGDAAIAVRAVSHAFDQPRVVEVLREVSIEVPRAAFAVIVGPSGCGKSTLLRMLAGLLPPDSGAVAIDGADASKHRSLAGFMPQRDLLLPWRRVRDNAILGAQLSGVDRHQAREQAAALLGRFGLAGFEDAWPAQLSGGMRQRLALLRTFLMPRQTLLLDEPFGALDAITRREMQTWLQEVWLADQRTVLLVTHDVEEALILADVIFVMSPRPGRIVERIDVSLPRPRTDATTTTEDFVALKAAVLDALASGHDCEADGSGAVRP